jgi:alanine or glycine:cation symporter, AGCS family
VEFLSKIVEVGNQLVWETPASLPWLVVVLLAAGLFITLRLGFPQFHGFRHAVAVLRGKYDDPDDQGDVSHFQALSTALSATVGIGNIAGVAIAIHFGGPGAVFWMWVTAFFGMALKYAECTLAVEYRTFDANGHVAGGPMYYIERGLGKHWKPLAILFAICGVVASFGGGNMNQANTVAELAREDLGASAWLVGLVLATIVGLVILGGIRSIARVTSLLAPAMAVLYVFGAFIILALHAGEIPRAFAEIISSAFSPAASVSGSVAGVFTLTLLQGVRRGLFSNEAGQGSAPIAHAAAKTDEPAREGSVALLEPFIDTLVVCTMTALVIVITGVWDEKRPAYQPIYGTAIEHASGGDVGAMEVPVAEGVQDRVVFRANDAPVSDAVLVLDPREGQPFTGTLRLDGAGGAVGVTPEGDEVGLYVAGEMLATGAGLTGWAFQEGLSPIGPWGNWVVTLAVFLFAISTMISWSYYGDRCIHYLFGERAVLVYRVAFIGFVYVGANTALHLVWKYGDLALGLMTVPNLLAVAILSPKVVRITRDYFARMKAQAGS